jgi:SAM-dependent methyltransferase
MRNAVLKEYSHLAEEYDSRWSFYTEATTKKTLSKFNLKGSEKVLDVGCGTGVLLKHLTESYPATQLYGVDPVKEMLSVPTFGGVVTNHMLHGFTRIGTDLFPATFTYFAFWGMGKVMKNGKVIDSPRLIHGMLTENVRGKGYTLDFDKEVSPGGRLFHLMVAPFMPVPKKLSFKKAPVNTGFTLPNGMKLTFWHVMFSNLQIHASRK